MRLQLRFLEAGIGAPCHILTDEHGNELPGQREVRVAYAINQRPTITVVFEVDGEDIAITNLPVFANSAVVEPGIVHSDVLEQ